MEKTKSFLENFSSLKYAKQIKTILLIFALIFISSIIVSIELSLFAHRIKELLKLCKENPNLLADQDSLKKEFEKNIQKSIHLNNKCFQCYYCQ
jgi:hypothetical protein